MTPARDGVLVAFSVDRALPPDERDGRERALVVRAVDIG
jgi:hypothetical protein